MDDESYFTVDGSDTKFNTTYLTHSSVPVPPEIKYREKSKSPEKVMVWVALSSKGLSKAYIIESGNAVNWKTYTKKCLTKVKEFIEEKYPNNDYIFWPDLASSHYAKQTLKFY